MNRFTSLLHSAEMSLLPPRKWALWPPGLRCHTSLGIYPDAGVLGAGCAGAPAAPCGRRQGLQISVVDFVVLLAALLRKRTQIVNIVTRNILQKHNPNGRFKVGRRCHRCVSGPTPRHGACQHQAQAATAHPRPTPAPEPYGVPASWGIAVGCSSPHSQLILTLLGRPEASASRTSLLGGGRMVIRAKGHPAQPSSVLLPNFSWGL